MTHPYRAHIKANKGDDILAITNSYVLNHQDLDLWIFPLKSYSCPGDKLIIVKNQHANHDYIFVIYTYTPFKSPQLGAKAGDSELGHWW